MPAADALLEQPVEDEECIEWGPPPELAVPEQLRSSASATDPELRRSVCVAVGTVILSIPALLGAWCWPLFLAGLFSGLSAALNTSGAIHLTHSLTWGINIAIFTNMLQFVGRRCAAKSKTLPYGTRWGPFWCVFFGMIGVMLDLTRHLINDNFNIMPMFDKNHNLTIYGWVSSVLGTWCGAILLVTGVLWETRVMKKLKVAFRNARATGVQ